VLGLIFLGLAIGSIFFADNSNQVIELNWYNVVGVVVSDHLMT